MKNNLVIDAAFAAGQNQSLNITKRTKTACKNIIYGKTIGDKKTKRSKSKSAKKGQRGQYHSILSPFKYTTPDHLIYPPKSSITVSEEREVVFCLPPTKFC